MTDTPTMLDVPPRAPIEFRTATEFAVNFAERTIELVAMPYDTDAIVEYPVGSGRMIVESQAPGSYDGVERRANRVKVNRDHDELRTVGRALALHPSRSEGLVAELRIARTPLGDDTLALADDRCLEASVAFAPMQQQWLEQRTRRRVTKAFLANISLVPEGAYEGRVLAVRSAADLFAPRPAPTPTPNLDEVLSWLRQ